MATPNPENPLEADIGTQYTNDRAAFLKVRLLACFFFVFCAPPTHPSRGAPQTAKEWTKKHGALSSLPPNCRDSPIFFLSSALVCAAGGK